MNLFAVAVIRRDFTRHDFAVPHHVALVFDDFEVTFTRMLHLVDKAQRPIVRTPSMYISCSPKGSLCPRSRPLLNTITNHEHVLFHPVLGHHLVDEAALIKFLEYAVVDQGFRFDVLDFWIGPFHQAHDIRDTRRRGIGFLVGSKN